MLCALLVCAHAPTGAAPGPHDALVLRTDDGTSWCGVDALQHTAARAAARENRLADALPILEALRARCRDNRQYLFDYVAINSWAGRHVEAWAAGGHLTARGDIPPYVTEAIAVSARETGHYGAALAAYDVLQARDAHHLEAQIGRAVTLLRSGDTTRARQALRALLERAPERRDVLDLLRESYVAEGRLTGALDAAQAVLDRSPGSRAAQRLRLESLRALGAPRLALSLAAADTLNIDERAQVMLERIAADLRAARVAAAEHRNRPDRWSATDRALQDAEDAIQAHLAAGLTAAARAGQYDLLVGLVDRGRSQNAIELYEHLTSTGATPAFVKLSAASAYLALRRPAEAAALYEAALDSDPRNLAARLAYFYALLESGQPHAAVQLMERLARDTPEWRDAAVPELRRANPDYAPVQARLGLALAYTDRLDAAQRHLDALALRAPSNLDIRNSRNIVYQLRGWPRRAERDYEWILAAHPEYEWASVALFDSAMEVRDYPRAHAWLARARASLPDEDATRTREARWTVHRRPELQFAFETGRGYGDSPVAEPGTARDRSIDVVLYSRPLAHDWRAYGRVNHASQHSGDASRRRTAAGAGVEYRARDWLAAGEVRAMGDARAAAIAGRITHELGDHLTLAGEAESNSLAVPVRAYAGGIDARRGALEIRYRLHESSSAGMGWSHMRLSDGNRRHAWFGNIRQRLVSGPAYRLEARVDAYASANSLTPPADYFNPAEDRSLAITLGNEWLQYRVYEHALRHRVLGTAGAYWQQGYGSDALWAVRYELSYEPDRQLTLNGGLAVTWRPFDGTRERLLNAYLSGNWRF